MQQSSRREFVAATACAAAAWSVPATRQALALGPEEPIFKISLAQWSLHKALQSQQLKHLEFAGYAKREFGVEAVEYVNQFFQDKAKDQAFLSEMKHRAEDAGVRSLLIMCDGEGDLGNPDATARTQAVENHYRWVEAAKFLGGHSIRVNAKSEGSFEEQQRLAADGLRKLSEFAADHDMHVIVENHGGLSSHGDWLAGVMKRVNMRNCGTLPDFGNFYEYDRYQGVTELMPYAQAVSAKSHDFDAHGNEVHTDYYRMMNIVLHAGYHGYVGIEYEGDKDDEVTGIRKTQALLERIRVAFS